MGLDVSEELWADDRKHVGEFDGDELLLVRRRLSLKELLTAVMSCEYAGVGSQEGRTSGTPEAAAHARSQSDG